MTGYLGRIGGRRRVGAVLPLDLLAVSAVAAYSLRRAAKTYAGPCIRVRRASDSAEMDIGFAGNALDAAALLSFVGAGSGFVRTWYDQAGGGRHMVQTTAAAQPQIVANGAYLGGVQTDQAGAWRLAATDAAFGLAAAPASICSLLGATGIGAATLGLVWALGGASGSRIFFGVNAANRDVIVRPSGTNRLASPGLSLPATGSAIGFSKSASANASGCRVRVNDSAPSTFAAEAFGATDNTFGLNNSSNTVVTMAALHREHIIYPAELSEVDFGAIARNQRSYFNV